MLINDLVRHPLHLALAYCRLSHHAEPRGVAGWADFSAQAYVPREIQLLLVADSAPESAAQVDISRHYPLPHGSDFLENNLVRKDESD